MGICWYPFLLPSDTCHAGPRPGGKIPGVRGSEQVPVLGTISQERFWGTGDHEEKGNNTEKRHAGEIS